MKGGLGRLRRRSGEPVQRARRLMRADRLGPDRAR